MIPVPIPPKAPGLVLGTSLYAAGDLVWRSPGATNLLRTNQATGSGDGTTTGFSVSGGDATATLASSTAQAWQGLRSLAVTSVSGPILAMASPPGSTGVAGVPVVGGRAYTMVARIYSAAARTAYCRSYWYKPDGTAASTTSSSGTSVTTSAGWTEIRVTAVAPSDAAFCIPAVLITSPTAGEVFYLDGWGFWEGPGGTWAMPGEPIQGLGTYWDESVGRRCFAWDQVNARWQMVYGDTGWRSNPGWFGTDWDESSFHIRRIGWQVQTAGYLKRVTASGSVSGASLAAIPTGWRSNTAVSMARPTDLLLGGGVNHNVGITSYGSVGAYRFAISVLSGVTWSHSTWAANDRWHLHSTWETVDAWPTALPGTASGTIPTG